MNEEVKEFPHRLHLVGVSGAGMLPLALCLKQANCIVTGEDEALSGDAARFLSASDIEIDSGDSLESLEEEVVVVRSSAIVEDHPTLQLAARKGWKTMRRGECLALLATRRKLIAIAGSHGKTTTCGMLIDLLENAGEQASYLLGGLFADGKAPGRWSDSEWIVAELDESDGTIDRFSPEITVILNADHDHHSRYENEAAYLRVFEELGKRTKGPVILNTTLRESIGAALGDRKVLYPDVGTSSDSGSNRFGRFNQENQQFAIEAATEAGFEVADQANVCFAPIKRRQSYLYFSPQLKVIEDYAHHPAELGAMAEALSTVSGARTIAVFQPHRYSRTKSMKRELAATLKQFDFVYLLEVYAASESPIAGGSGEDLLRACQERFAHCDFVDSDDRLIELLLDECSGGSELNIAFLGAGRTDAIGRRFVERLASKDSRWGSLFAGIAGNASFQSRIRSQEALSSKTTLRVGGAAELFFEPSSLEELQTALRICDEGKIPVFVLGRGSNLIISDTGVPGLVIRLSHPAWKRFERLDGGEIRVGAGMRIKELCGVACREGLEGFEFLEGIPGSVGGALRMNAGAMGGWMFDVVKSVRYLTMDGVLVEANADELSVGYRHCEELKTAVALDVVLASKAVGRDEADLRRQIDVYQSKRKESQPREPSAGCIFKNPKDDSAGRLIEELGLKGTVIGGAEISEAHGNFIINRGGATSEDVIELVRLARRVVKDRRSIELEPEALLCGRDWEEALS